MCSWSAGSCCCSPRLTTQAPPISITSRAALRSRSPDPGSWSPTTVIWLKRFPRLFDPCPGEGDCPDACRSVPLIFSRSSRASRVARSGYISRTGDGVAPAITVVSAAIEQTAGETLFDLCASVMREETDRMLCWVHSQARVPHATAHLGAEKPASMYA